LEEAYVTVIDAKGLRAQGSRRGPKGPVGGLTKESSDEHFALAFDGSAARAILAVLDPKDHAGSTSDHFVKVTAGATLLVTDAPCGAGAAALGFLTVLAQLRAEGVLPRMPLDVRLIGAELSPFARQHALEMFELVKGELARQAIFVELELVEWDVTDVLSTTELVRLCISKEGSKCAKMLIVANFNGFLEREKKRREAEPQLNELFRYAAGGSSFATWIEPDMNRASGSGGFFPWLFKLFSTGPWGRFGKVNPLSSPENPMFQSAARFRLPLVPGDSARVTLAVMPIELKT
jgi:hypothetical protein